MDIVIEREVLFKSNMTRLINNVKKTETRLDVFEEKDYSSGNMIDIGKTVGNICTVLVR